MSGWVSKISSFVLPGVKSKRTVYGVVFVLLATWLFVAIKTGALPPFDWSHLVFLAIIVGASGSSV